MKQPSKAAAAESGAGSSKSKVKGGGSWAVDSGEKGVAGAAARSRSGTKLELPLHV